MSDDLLRQGEFESKLEYKKSENDFNEMIEQAFDDINNSKNIELLNELSKAIFEFGMIANVPRTKDGIDMDNLPTFVLATLA